MRALSLEAMRAGSTVILTRHGVWRVANRRIGQLVETRQPVVLVRVGGLAALPLLRGVSLS